VQQLSWVEQQVQVGFWAHGWFRQSGVVSSRESAGMVPNPAPPDRLAKPCRDYQRVCQKLGGWFKSKGEMLEVIGYVVAGVMVIYVIYYGMNILLRFLFQQKPKNWVIQNYKNYSGVDFHKVERFIANESPATEEFSHWEMVAVFGLLLVRESITDVVRKAAGFGKQGWKKNFNYDFYNEIAQIAKKVSAQGDEYSARKLMVFGQRLAEMYEERNWAEQYKTILDEQLLKEVYLERDRSRK
jgi:hypothetical protein